MLLSRLGRRVLLKRLNTFYRTLSPEQKALFDNKYLCLKATPKNKGFVFLKFVANFWKGKIYRKKAEQLMANIGISNTEYKATFGAYPNKERERMLTTIQIPYVAMYSDKQNQKAPKPFTQMVVVCDSSLKKPMGMFSTSVKIPPEVKNVPLTLSGYSSFELDHATLSFKGRDKSGKPLGHALSCIRAPNGEYRIIEPNGNQDPVRWTDPKAVHLFMKSGWYKEAYDWEITEWGYNALVYIRNSNLPVFTQEKTPVNLGRNKEGRTILQGPRGGRYVQYAVGKGAKLIAKPVTETPKVEKVGTNIKGRVVYQGPDGGRFVIYTRDGKRFKRYLKKGTPSPIKTPKKKPIGTNSKGRSIYKGPSGGRYVIVTSKDGKRYKKYLPGQK